MNEWRRTLRGHSMPRARARAVVSRCSSHPRQDLATAGQRFQPGGEVVGNRDDPAGGGLGLAGTHLDDPAVQVHGGPVQAGEFRHADAGERADGEHRDEMRRGGVQERGHLVRREDPHVVADHLDLLQSAVAVGRSSGR